MVLGVQYSNSIFFFTFKVIQLLIWLVHNSQYDESKHTITGWISNYDFVRKICTKGAFEWLQWSVLSQSVGPVYYRGSTIFLFTVKNVWDWTSWTKRICALKRGWSLHLFMLLVRASSWNYEQLIWLKNK